MNSWAFNSMSSSQLLIVFDGDDTLWMIESHYDRAREAAGKVVEAAGLDPVEWDKLQRRIDVENVRSMGLSSSRFPTSCRQAYEWLCECQGHQPDDTIANKVYRVASSVFEKKAELVPDAKEVLRLLSDSAVLVLLTKGDPSVQKGRVQDSGLGPYFDDVCIVDQKTKETFVDLARRFDVPPEKSWSIGNSLASDINPAVRAGWRAIWIDAHVWEHERRETEPHSNAVVVLDRLRELPEIFRGEGAGTTDARRAIDERPRGL